MSELYKEALAETKKIKELAEADAKRKIIEEVSPFIKQMIVKETAFFFEEEEAAPSMETSGDSAPIVPTGATMDTSDSEIEVVEPEKNVDVSDPLGIMSKTLKDLVGEEGKIAIDPSGKITIEPAMNSVDLTKTEQPTTAELGAGSPPPTDLAPTTAPAEPVTPVASPESTAPAEPATSVASPESTAPAEPAKPDTAAQIAENYRGFQINLGETALKIDELYFSKKPSQIMAESLKHKLFQLLENLDYLNHSGEINKTQFILNEKKLEFLFEKLKEAKTGNSYSIKGNKNMGSLKEFASKLFEGEEKSLAHDAASSGNTGVAVHAAASAHAKKVSGVAPDVDLFDNQETVEKLHGEALPGVGDAEEPDGWENAEPGALEETLELNEAELLEAVRALREGKKKKVVKENADLEEGVTISLGLPDDLELDASDVTLSVEEDEDMEDEDELELELDDEDSEEEMEEEESEEESEEEMEEEESEEEMEEEESEEEMEEESEEEEAGMLYGNMEEKAMEEGLYESVLRSRNSKRAKLLESKLHQTVKAASKVKKLAESRNRELQIMKSEMAETNLFLSKVLLLNKFLQRDDLSQKQKQVIVEHLDRAQTIAEAKEIYVKIKNKLNEAVTKDAVRTGSASAPVSSGAASFKVISESANQVNDVVLGTPERWALLVKGRRDD